MHTANYCSENDRQAHGKSAFFQRMKDKGYFVKRTCNEGFIYQGIRLIDPDERYADDPEDDLGNGFHKVEGVTVFDKKE